MKAIHLLESKLALSNSVEEFSFFFFFFFQLGEKVKLRSHFRKCVIIRLIVEPGG